MGLPDLRPQARQRTAQEMLQHLRSFELDLKFTAGIWFFSPFASRFHDKYTDDVPLEQRLELAATLQDDGLVGLEAHYPNEINEDNLSLWQDFTRDTGIRLVTVIPLLFYDAQFEFGSLSNPDDDVRQNAIDRTIRSLELNKELDCDFCVVWPGIDGFENPFGHDFAGMRRRFAEGLAEAMDRVPGVRIAFEPKPYEPRGRILFGLTPEGVLLGHVLMGFEDLAYAYSWPLSEGRLAHTHWNSQPLGNYDQDQNVGVLSPEQTEALLYTLKLHGYRGLFGIDINPERMPVTQAMRNSMDAIRAANDRVNAVDHEHLLYALQHPDEARGWVEAHLIRLRAPSGTRLRPLPTPQEFSSVTS